MPMDYSKLRGKIREVFLTQANFAKALGISERTLSLKLNGNNDWRLSEIIKAADLLGVANNEIYQYFFNKS